MSAPDAPPPSILGSFGRYAVVSAISFAGAIGITVGLHEGAGVSPELSYGTALVAIFLMNFALMRYWVYRHTREESSAKRQFLLTAMASVTFRLMEFGAFLLLHTWLGLYYIVAVVGIMAVSNLSKFFFYHSVVFAWRSNK